MACQQLEEQLGKTIGALLADGIGDTVRVSLAESPESEILVACLV